MYALSVADDTRILSACVVLPNGSYDNMHTVDTLPSGETDAEKNIHNWLYIDGCFVFDPLPSEEPEAHRTTEERLTELEEAFDMILSGVTK